MGGIGWQELLVVLLIVLLLFGAKRLPDLSRSFGKSIREFKRGIKEGVEEPGGDDAKKKSENPAADEGTKGAA